MTKHKRKLNRDYALIMKVVTVILVLYCASLIYPMIWALMTSFKGTLDYISNPLGFPKVFEFNNYLLAYQHFYINIEVGANQKYIYIEEMIFNSMLYALGSAFFATLTSTITAYTTARFNYKFSKVIYWIVIITMILPIVGALPSEIQITKSLGLYDSIFGLFVLKANFLGLYYLVFYAMFKSVPQDYTDAAKIDGASNFQIFSRIMLPMAKKIFFTVMLIQFINFWNDYQTPLIYLPTKPTLAVGLFNYSTSTVNAISSTPVKLAGALMVFIPIFIVFILMQKRLIGGMDMGGVKE
jgi:ABC-type glycerol-3-phosphate transport system permease component